MALCDRGQLNRLRRSRQGRLPRTRGALKAFGAGLGCLWLRGIASAEFLHADSSAAQRAPESLQSRRAMLRFGVFLMGLKGAAGPEPATECAGTRAGYDPIQNGPYTVLYTTDRYRTAAIRLKKRELRAGGRVRRERPSVGSPWRERVLGRRDYVRWHLLVRPDPDRKRPQL